MAFAHGKKAKVYGTGVDLSGFLKSANSGGSVDLADTSTLGSDDKTFLSGLMEGSLGLEGIFSAKITALDPSQIADIFDAALGGTDVVVCHLPQGDGFGNVCYGVKGPHNTVEIMSPIDDVVTINGELTSNTGMSSARVLHPKQAETTDANGTQLDNGATGSPSLKGGTGFLHVFAHTGASSTFKIQHSPDNSVWTDLITFTAVTAAETAEGIVLPAGTSVARYVRAVWDVPVAGSATFHISFSRNP